MSPTTQAIAAPTRDHAWNEVLQKATLTQASDKRELLSSLNLVLSEVIDVGQDVKEAHHKVSAVHAELDRLLEDLGRWARTLAEEDQARNVSPLERMPSVVGRKPHALWAGTPTDGDVRRTLFEHLTRLASEVEQALGQEPEEAIRAALTSVRAGVIKHLAALHHGMSFQV